MTNEELLRELLLERFGPVPDREKERRRLLAARRRDLWQGMEAVERSGARKKQQKEA